MLTAELIICRSRKVSVPFCEVTADVHGEVYL